MILPDQNLQWKLWRKASSTYLLIYVCTYLFACLLTYRTYLHPRYDFALQEGAMELYLQGTVTCKSIQSTSTYLSIYLPTGPIRIRGMISLHKKMQWRLWCKGSLKD